MSLYPLKFTPILKDKIWGGNKLKTVLNKDFSPLPNAGESWEISGVEGDISVVSNGFLAGNNLEELIEIYMGDLVGDPVYEQFGVEFPLLIKFIDANDVLSIQVHPDDELSKERHNAYGKTEMWYVIEADKDTKRLSLSLKKLLEDPWNNVERKYPLGNIVLGKVVRFTNFGAFVELEPGVDGLVYITEISYTKIEKPQDVLKVGEMVKAKILNVNKEQKRISLSIKEVSNN